MPFNFTPPNGAITDVELGYAELAITTTFSGSASQDISPLSISFTGRNRPFYLECNCPQVGAQGGVAGAVVIAVTDAANTTYALGGNFLSTANGNRTNIYVSRRMAASPGTTYTFKARIFGPAATSYQIAATTAQVTYIRAVEV